MAVKKGLPRSTKGGPGPERRALWERLDQWWLLFLGVALFTVYLARSRPDPYLRILVFLRDGLRVTVGVTTVSFVFIMLVGLIGGLGRISKVPLIKGIASVYVEIIRGIPLLVQLMFIYYASPIVIRELGLKLANSWPTLSARLVAVKINPYGAAVVGLTICYGAFMSEIFRAGIESIPKGQMEAARSLGMGYIKAMRYVILPQAIRTILPPVGNEFISLLKDSSLVSVVAVADLTRRGREFMASTFMPLETWLMVALVYLLMTLFLSRVVAYVEERTSYYR
ncbi:MAG TPA: amino acid ABC transporter permease [Anaerolineae bacterium]|nr:amino acid ABC transporter permease [Anaerolineae bacterium]HQJ51092.1 amino acid ABC transporter permease [Anaerolineae bacterium]